MGERYPMPYIVTMCSTVGAYHTEDCEEANKYSFHSLHSEDNPLSGSSSVSALFKLNMAGETANSRTDGSISSVTTRMAEAILWGVRQRSVRDISKCDAGTLPSFAIAEETNLAEVVCNTMSFEGEQAEEENQPLVGVEVDIYSTPVVIKKGEFLAFKGP